MKKNCRHCKYSTEIVSEDFPNQQRFRCDIYAKKYGKSDWPPNAPDLSPKHSCAEWEGKEE